MRKLLFIFLFSFVSLLVGCETLTPKLVKDQAISHGPQFFVAHPYALYGKMGMFVENLQQDAWLFPYRRDPQPPLLFSENQLEEYITHLNEIEKLSSSLQSDSNNSIETEKTITQTETQEKSTVETEEEKPSKVLVASLAQPSQIINVSIRKRTRILPPSPAPESYKNLWHRLQNGYGLEYDAGKLEILASIKKYTSYNRFFEKISQRAAPYLYYIVEEIEKRGMPLELALLPVIESGYEPTALSHVNAAGIWQFMPVTGENFGLKQTLWYDARRDIITSTQAALDYLHYLHKFFDGDWLLALAAYNYGEGNMQKAINKNLEEGKPTDFWSLELPKETRQFVPNLIAISHIVAQPELYGINLNYIANEPYLKEIKITKQIDLTVAAKLAGLSTNEFKRLNPGYRRIATGPNGPHRLALPIHKVKLFQRKLSKLPKSELMPPDTQALLAELELESQKQMEAQAKEIAEKYPNLITHKIVSGENLSIIAMKHKLSVKELVQLNKLENYQILAGQTLKVPEIETEEGTEEDKAKTKKPQRKKIIYTVKSGDSLWKIAKSYQTSIDKLTQWNNLKTRRPLQLGQKLTIWEDS